MVPTIPRARRAVDIPTGTFHPLRQPGDRLGRRSRRAQHGPVNLGALLVARLHIDLVRVCSAACPACS